VINEIDLEETITSDERMDIFSNIQPIDILSNRLPKQKPQLNRVKSGFMMESSDCSLTAKNFMIGSQFDNANEIENNLNRISKNKSRAYNYSGISNEGCTSTFIHNYKQFSFEIPRMPSGILDN